jgi:hypothetical protein
VCVWKGGEAVEEIDRVGYGPGVRLAGGRGALNDDASVCWAMVAVFPNQIQDKLENWAVKCSLDTETRKIYIVRYGRLRSGKWGIKERGVVIGLNEM